MIAFKLPKSSNYFLNQLTLFDQFTLQFRSRDKNGKIYKPPYKFVPCKADHWKLLGDNFYDYYSS